MEDGTVINWPTFSVLLFQWLQNFNFCRQIFFNPFLPVSKLNDQQSNTKLKYVPLLTHKHQHHCQQQCQRPFSPEIRMLSIEFLQLSSSFSQLLPMNWIPRVLLSIFRQSLLKDFWEKTVTILDANVILARRIYPRIRNLLKQHIKWHSLKGKASIK